MTSVRRHWGALPCLALLALGSLPACGPRLATVLTPFVPPVARVIGVELDRLSMESVDVVFTVEISNPYTVSMPVVAFDYDFGSEGGSFFAEFIELEGAVARDSSDQLVVPVTVAFAGLLEAPGTMQPGDVVEYAADLGLHVETPGVGRFRVPLSGSGVFPVPTPLQPDLPEVKWTRLTMEQADAALSLHLHNPNQFAVELEQLEYSLMLGGIPVVSAAFDPDIRLEAGAEEMLHPQLRFAPAEVGIAAFRVLMVQGADYDLAGNVSVNTPYGPLVMPLHAVGGTEFRR